jgi:Ni/Fe-hydrogenase 1 B-type cytochrome subunit
MAHLAHYKEAHPLPLVITHYINLVCMILLIITGFNIHFPYWAGFMGMARGIHVFCGIVITINCIVRVIMAFTVESAPANGTRQTKKDIANWVPGLENKHQGGAWIKFYLFIKRDHPLAGKFGVPQKISYFLIPFLLLFMAYTGFCLWVPTASWPIFAAGTVAFGGLMSVRIIHYFMMFVFILFTMIHVYMACTEGGVPLLALMFARKEHGGYTYDINTHDLSGEDNSIK